MEQNIKVLRHFCFIWHGVVIACCILLQITYHFLWNHYCASAPVMDCGYSWYYRQFVIEHLSVERCLDDRLYIVLSRSVACVRQINWRFPACRESNKWKKNQLWLLETIIDCDLEKTFTAGSHYSVLRNITNDLYCNVSHMDTHLWVNEGELVFNCWFAVSNVSFSFKDDAQT